ncbi:hypothetical protein RKD52_001513 [Metabacillus sp. SLBN-84]
MEYQIVMHTNRVDCSGRHLTPCLAAAPNSSVRTKSPKKSNPDFSGDFLSDSRSKTGASAFLRDEEGTGDPASEAKRLQALPAESK